MNKTEFDKWIQRVMDIGAAALVIMAVIFVFLLLIGFIILGAQYLSVGFTPQ